MAKEPDKNKQDLWDQAKVVNEVEHRFGQNLALFRKKAGILTK